MPTDHPNLSKYCTRALNTLKCLKNSCLCNFAHKSYGVKYQYLWLKYIFHSSFHSEQQALLCMVHFKMVHYNLVERWDNLHDWVAKESETRDFHVLHTGPWPIQPHAVDTWGFFTGIKLSHVKLTIHLNLMMRLRICFHSPKCLHGMVIKNWDNIFQ